MNKLTKIGLSALAGSLVAVSAQAGTLSVAGSASLTFSDSDVDSTIGSVAEGNQWTMGDSLTFTGSGDMDNGMSISVSYELDGQGAAVDTFDSHSMTLNTNGMGSITFAGHGGGGALDGIDDTSPNAYEESWDGVANADEETIPNGVTSDNMFTYVSEDFGGATVTIGYVPQGATGTPNGHYMDMAVKITPEAVEGLTLGFGMGETEETAGVFGGAIDAATIAVDTSASAADALTAIDTAIAGVDEQRDTFGAALTRLGMAVDNLSNTKINVEASRSRVQDTDYATETAELARTQIIAQAGIAMLAQANARPQLVLQLIKQTTSTPLKK